jgi:outer membrane protein TolC
MEFMKPDSAHYGITPALSLPIFDGGRLRGQLLAQTGAFDEAVAQYNKTLLTALQQAAEALTRLNTLSERRRSVNDDLHAACGNRSIAERRFHAGLTNRLPVLAAESEILRLQAQTLSLNTDAIDALTRLFTALGGAVIPNTLPGAQS